VASAFLSCADLLRFWLAVPASILSLFGASLHRICGILAMI